MSIRDGGCSDVLDQLPGASKRTRNGSSASEVPQTTSYYVAVLITLGLVSWVCDGRSCKCCGEKDETGDPVWPALPGRRWSYPLERRGVN